MKRSRQFLSKVNISNFKPSRIRLNSIRTKTIAIMLVMTLLPLGGTTQYLITQFRKAEEAKVKDYSMRIAQDKALELEMLIKEKVNMIQGMTRNDLVFKGQKISDIMNRLLVLDYYDINIDQINYITRDNIRYTPARYEYVVQEEQRAEQEAAEAEQAELEGNAEQAEQTEQTEQEELTGEENAEPVELLPFEERVERTGTKISDNPHFEKAKNEGVVVIGDVRNKTVTAQLLPIYIPFRDNEVQFNGAIEVLLASSNFYSRITSIALEESGYGFLIAQDGKFVTHKNTQYNTKRYDEFIQDEDSIHVFENTILKEDSGYVEYVDEEGQLLAASFMTIPSTQWRVVVVAPKEEIYATIDSLENLSRIAAAVVLLIVFVAGIIVANNQVKPIIRISRLMEKVAAGNLRERLPEKRKDEIGQLSRDINRTHESLSELIRQLNGSIGQIALASEELSSISEQSAQASNQISASIENVAEGARTQEESADKVNQTTVEMSNEIAKIADTQQKVFETITVASADLFNGNEKIGNIIQQMNHIENSVKHSAQVVRELGAKSSEIGNVMTIISEVANQTNLLALNASIEAARAGEHGRGFAVVANEVKKLASKTQDSISDVSRIIGEIQDYIESTVKSMNEDLAEVSKGMQVTEETGEVFQNMIERVEQIVSQSEQVSEATNQISNGARQVVEVMNQYAQIGKEIVDSVSNVSAASEEQLAGMEEISASASRLDQMAKELKDLVNRFTV